MKNIKISDMTLCRNSSLSFKERIEIARLLERLNVDCIELPQIENVKSDTLLVKTVSSFVKESVLSVCGGYSKATIDLAAASLSNAKKGDIRIEIPVSPVGMEYTLHKKAPAILELIKELVAYAKEKCQSVQFCAVDATRAEESFLIEAVNTAIEYGATAVTVCDTSAETLPDNFAWFISKLIADIPALSSVKLGVQAENKNGMASASSILAVKANADIIKTDASGTAASLETVAAIIKNCGNNYGFECNIKHTETARIIGQINRITTPNTANATVKAENDNEIQLDANDNIDAVAAAIKTLGYDLSDEDTAKVYEEFKVIADKKRVGAKELDAIIASTALQVPPTYKLVSYVINNGNIISSSAQIRISKDGSELEGICIGDGPVDAAFRAVEQIIGRHYELEDFQIHTVTEGKESVGSALVKLRENGKIYLGTGISTDILGASIRAYINALNKIAYEEEN